MCAVLVTLPIPISRPNENDVGFSSRLDGDLLLSWDLPSCADCEAKGEFCGFANSTSQEIICFDLGLFNRRMNREFDIQVREA